MYLTSRKKENLYYDKNDNLNKGILKNSQKIYSFDGINELTDEGYLFSSKYKNKSVTITHEGIELVEELIKKYLKQVVKNEL